MENGVTFGLPAGGGTHRQLGLSLPLLLCSEALLFSSFRSAPLLGEGEE